MADEVSIPKNAVGFVQDKNTGLLIPAEASVTAFDHPFNDGRRSNLRNNLLHRGGGVNMDFDEATGIPFWPAYASGMDDYLMRALVTGYMANGGQTPVLMTMLSTIVAKRQAMAGTWATIVQGKASPVKAALDLISRADDSDLGPTEFVQQLVGAVDTDNRGAFVAQVPINRVAFDKWSEYGMDAVPIAGAKKDDLFVLEMTTDQFRENQGVWNVDGLECLPTGNRDFPFWFRTFSAQRRRPVWVLISRDFGFQVIQHSGGKNSQYPGWGQSGCWRFSPYMVKDIAISRMDWEHLIAQPPRGIVWVSGLDWAQQFREQLLAYHKEREENNQLFYPGVFFGGSVGENSQLVVIPWVEPPAGYTPQEWTNELVSNLAASFQMNETHLRLRLGEGALTQSGVADSLEAETSISWLKHIIQMTWNQVVPPRIMVTVVWQSDRVTRLQVEIAERLSLAISRLQKMFPGAPEEFQEPTFSRLEVRAMWEQLVGLEIPDAEEEDESADQRSTGEDIEDYFQRRQMPILASLPYPNSVRYALGNQVCYLNGAIGDFRDGRIVAYSGSGDLVWVRLAGVRREMLFHAGNLRALALGETIEAQQRAGGSANLLPFPPGSRARLGLTPVTVVRQIGDDVYYRYDWDTPWIDLRQDAADLLIPLSWQTDDDPAEPPEYPDLDPDQAADSAIDLWYLHHPDDDLYRTMLDEWEWDEEARQFIDPETGELTDLEGDLVPLRNHFAEATAAQHTWLPEEEPEDDEGLSLVALLLFGFITLAAWEEQMRDAIQDALAAQFMLGRGGDGSMSDLDWDRMEEELMVQYNFLHEFAEEIAAGTLTAAEIAARSALYFSATVIAFSYGRENAYDYRMVLPCNPGDCSSECCARDRCYWRTIENDDGTITSKWIRTVAESCPTCRSRALCPPVVFIIETGEHQNIGCYV